MIEGLLLLLFLLPNSLLLLPPPSHEEKRLRYVYGERLGRERETFITKLGEGRKR